MAAAVSQLAADHSSAEIWLRTAKTILERTACYEMHLLEGNLQIVLEQLTAQHGTAD